MVSGGEELLMACYENIHGPGKYLGGPKLAEVVNILNLEVRGISKIRK